jgi:hypothetical protein
VDPRTGDTDLGAVSLRAHANNNWVCADNAGVTPLKANRANRGRWEQFDLRVRGGSVALLADANTSWVTTQSNGQLQATAFVRSGSPEFFDILHL